MWKKTMTSVALCAGIAAVLTACGNTQPATNTAASTKPVDGGTLNVAVQSDIPSLDPAVGVDTESIQYVDSIYDQLVTFSPTSLQIVPDLAKSWAWNPNHTQITFHLRNAKFSNGDPVTAADVKFSVEFILNPKSTASLNIYRGLVGAAAYMKSPTGNLQGVKVIDSHTVQFTLSQPEPYFLSALASGTGSVMDENVVKPLSFNAAAISQHAVGSGAYMVKSWAPGKSIVLVKNPNYWRPGLPHLNEIDTQIGVSPSNQYLLFKQGKLDVIGGALTSNMQIDSNSFLSAMGDPRLKSDYLKNTGLITYFLSLNTQMKPFTNVKVRQAVADSMDIPALIKILNGRAVAANQLLPPGLVGHDNNLPPLKQNISQAKQLLQQAGYGPSNPVKFTLVTMNDPVSINVGAALQNQMAQAGIKVSLKPEAQAPYIQGLLTPNTDQASYGLWIDDYPDPQDFMFNILDGNNPGGFDTSFYNNPQVNQDITKGDTSFDNNTRTTAYENAQNIAIQEGAIVPLFYGVMDVLKQPTLQPQNPLYYVHQVLPIQFQYLWKPSK
ncbi:ABC transporter substrate-binding protein [Alicyclobacillus curvatus]|nr:ABC transporter substrate-binding protein [Alicyclobacillus curvatus]